jgi:hypothetical protein
MAAYTIFICGNDETICDGFTDHRTAAWKDEIGAAFVEAACGAVRDAEQYGGDALDYEVDRVFREWHGGRFDQVYQRCGLVAVAKDVPQWLVDLAWAAGDAGSAARDKYVAELEAEADRFAADEAAND